MDLVAHQWKDLEHLFPSEPGRKGRPKAHPRDIINGINWVCRTGEAWQNLPRRYAPPTTCHRKYVEWRESGTWELILLKLAMNLKDRAGIDLLPLFSNGKYSSTECINLISVHLHRFSVSKGWEWYTLLLFMNPYVTSYDDGSRSGLIDEAILKDLKEIEKGGKSEFDFSAA